MRPAPISLLGPLRRPAPFVAGIAFLLFAVLAVRYAGNGDAGRIDVRTENAVDAVAGVNDRFLRRLTEFGSPPFVVATAIMLAAACLLLRRPRLAVLAVVGPGLTGVATTVLKPVIGRTIGGPEDFAYPSGHTGGATSIALVAALLLIGLVPAGRAASATLVAAAALLAGGAVGAGMVSLGAHYPTDTVGGFAVAIAIGLAAALVIDRVGDGLAERRRGRYDPASPRPAG